MERDMDLIREILLRMEDSEHGYTHDVKIEGRSNEEVGFHVWLLKEAGLIRATDITPASARSPQSLPSCITWQGYEFIAAMKNPSTWETGKKAVLAKAGAISFEVIKAYLVFEAKKQLGIG